MIKLLRLVLVLTSIALYGCSKKGCTDATADNYDPDATESSDNCIPARDKFLGDYLVQANCTDTSYVYNISIITATGLNKIVIQNFGDYAIDVNASVSGSLVEITEDTYGTKIISGSGELSGYTMVLHYIAVEIGTSDTVSCTITAVK